MYTLGVSHKYVQPCVGGKWETTLQEAVPNGDSLLGPGFITADKVGGHGQLSAGPGCFDCPSRSQYLMNTCQVLCMV